MRGKLWKKKHVFSWKFKKFTKAILLWEKKRKTKKYAKHFTPHCASDPFLKSCRFLIFSRKHKRFLKGFCFNTHFCFLEKNVNPHCWWTLFFRKFMKKWFPHLTQPQNIVFLLWKKKQNYKYAPSIQRNWLTKNVQVVIIRVPGW